MGRSMSRRRLLGMIGLGAGSAAMYQAMQSLGFAAESNFKGPVQLSAAPKGASVLVLGAGLAGLVAAYELRQAGYRVQVLEYNARAGGRNWTLRGGDRYTELGGFTQECRFDPGLYINPGPWRLPYHHRGMLSYCQRLGVPLEPFLQVNYNAYVHSSQRLRRQAAAPAHRQGRLSRPYRGTAGQIDSRPPVGRGCHRRGPGKAARLAAFLGRTRQKSASTCGETPAMTGAAMRETRAADSAGGRRCRSRLALSDLLQSGLWSALPMGELYDMQTALFQPVGGMGKIGEAFARELGPLIRYNAKVVEIQQDARGVSATFEDTAAHGRQSVQADWCVCTIPLSILSQIPMNVGRAMSEAISAVPYAASVKVGLQFKRRFWEQDEQIYGGITYTDLPISTIGYPSSGLFGGGKGVLLGGYIWGMLDAAQFTAMPPDERVRKAVEYGARIHPQYTQEFDNGVAVAWHRAPFALGCFGLWTECDTRAAL